MGLPGGGRTVLSTRIIRHFNILVYTKLSDQSINNIFLNILNGFYEYHDDSIKELLGNLVQSTVSS